jgi:hypothetical protein
LTSRYAHRKDNSGTRSGSWPVLAVVCVILVALLAVVQVPHLHATQTDADHCPICIVLHSTAPASVAAAPVLLVQVGTATPAVEPSEVIQKRQSRLFIRPPPFGC